MGSHNAFGIKDFNWKPFFVEEADIGNPPGGRGQGCDALRMGATRRMDVKKLIHYNTKHTWTSFRNGAYLKGIEHLSESSEIYEKLLTYVQI